MIEKKSPAQIEKMREAGRVVARAHEAMEAAAGVGVTLREIDAVGAAVLAEHGATSPFLDYHPDWAPVPFPGVICASVNDAIVHGIPTDYALQDGDLLSVDFGAVLDGWCGDAARSYVVGTPRPGDQELVDVTRAALDAGIAAARPGNTIGDIGYAVAKVARDARVGILDDHGGHGIGSEMHMDPFIPNVGRRGKGMKLVPGLTIAIEPMFIADGRGSYTHDADGWTLRSTKGARAAHWEHTIVITADGPQILTAL
ncbi:type I methionyl aminopeptidase [Sanguibacter suaedae]|uniref:Methionine aminopeptidase n=1 Tax=Sanguibacter suaedae TaxID=2795737 RepID=A0A934IDS1_9MICO|nr:type I methionyl aminopeptidase [Sanguibacter suaedae]MBI9115074.1 type I methionyl aminopeptidase [Sanguibacter suaedae]